MANLKYKSGDNSWTSILLTRGATGPQGEPGQNGLDAEITLNGIKNRIAEFYAPTDAGQAGQFLMSNGPGQAPTFASVPAGTETINNLTTSTFVENQALSAYQGYILNQNKVDKSTTVAGVNLQDSITATELKTSLSIPTALTIGNTRKAFATGDINWSLDEIGAAPSSHSHNYLPLSGGKMTGNIGYANGDYSDYDMIKWKTGDNNGAGIVIGGGGAAIIGGGESADVVYNGLALTGGSERMCICNDQQIDLFPGQQSGYTAAGLFSVAAGGAVTKCNGVNVPGVFIQSGTPTAKQTGDIWIIP